MSAFPGFGGGDVMDESLEPFDTEEQADNVRLYSKTLAELKRSEMYATLGFPHGLPQIIPESLAGEGSG